LKSVRMFRHTGLCLAEFTRMKVYANGRCRTAPPLPWPQPSFNVRSALPQKLA
jgi:hypothetical protein